MKKIILSAAFILLALIGFSQQCVWHYKNNAEVKEYFRKSNEPCFEIPYCVPGSAPLGSYVNIWDGNGNITGRKEVKATFNYSIDGNNKTLTIVNFGDVNSYLRIHAVDMSIKKDSYSIDYTRFMYVFITPPGTTKTIDIPWLGDIVAENKGKATEGLRFKGTTQFLLSTNYIKFNIASIGQEIGVLNFNY